MKSDMFEALLESVRRGGAIVRGARKAGRRTQFKELDVAAIRATCKLSQEPFARLLGISVRTLQNWEQGRRRPMGPARVLLRVAARYPAAVLDTVREISQAHVRGRAGVPMPADRPPGRRATPRFRRKANTSP
jgi:putative transcriptional regulator